MDVLEAGKGEILEDLTAEAASTDNKHARGLEGLNRLSPGNKMLLCVF